MEENEQDTPQAVDTTVQPSPPDQAPVLAEHVLNDDGILLSAGVADGSAVVLQNGKDTGEKVVYDYQLDDDGNQVLDADGQPVISGWHKEVA